MALSIWYKLKSTFISRRWFSHFHSRKKANSLQSIKFNLKLNFLNFMHRIFKQLYIYLVENWCTRCLINFKYNFANGCNSHFSNIFAVVIIKLLKATLLLVEWILPEWIYVVNVLISLVPSRMIQNSWFWCTKWINSRCLIKNIEKIRIWDSKIDHWSNFTLYSFHVKPMFGPFNSFRENV